ncbi:MAG: sulfatase-like hydrolase/transferase, partial [Chloroflexota bacterium]
MPSVLLLMADEHNPRYAAPYGHPSVQTPCMDRLAAQGVAYESAYCPSPLCMPSRSAFVAGRYVHELGTYSNCNLLMEGYDYPTYGRALAEQGVYTAYVGKTHVYRPGRVLGFSEMILPGDTPPPGDANHGRRPLTIRPQAAERAGQFGPLADPFGADLKIMDAALAWLHQRAPALRQPWLLAVHLHKPHFPQWVTQELWDLYPQGGDLPAYGRECASAQHPYAQDLRAHFETEQFTEEQVRGLRRGYLGCVTFVDQQLGRLVTALEQHGLRETTDVIYTADHGEMLGKFGMWWKCSLYDDAVRVPLIAAGPSFSGGMRVRTPVSLLDVQAALFRCLGAARPPEWRGAPLQDVAPDDAERIVFAEYHGHGTRSGAFMLRQGGWKLIYYAEAPHQLFNLAEDPEELHNLAPTLPAKVAELERALRRICDPERECERAHAFERAQLERLEGWIQDCLL